MLSPKRVKHRKVMRGHMRGEATRCNTIAFGDYALVSMGLSWITARQIEAARIAMTRHIKRGGKVWIRIFPAIPYTKKPAETRMGKGKGSPEKWVAMVKPGTVMFEMNGVSPDVAKRAMELAGAKLPIHTKFVQRRVAEVLE
jgi:large subunit ribosomal protein L16